MALLEQLVPQVRNNLNKVKRIYDEKSFLSSYMPLGDIRYDHSCETCNNCGSGDCASCCSDTDD